MHSEDRTIATELPGACESTHNLSSILEVSAVEQQAIPLMTSISTASSDASSSLSYRSPDPPSGSDGTRRFGTDLSVDDICFICELGRGCGGIVCKMQHEGTRSLMVRKTFELDVKTSWRMQILRDLQILSGCCSPYIPVYYGAVKLTNTFAIHMEYMDAGGLDTLLPQVGRLPEPIVVRIADAVIKGLLYLWKELHILHRNLKPSNILLSRTGAIKLSDFVVSLPLAEALSSAFIGMRTYLAPERLTGEIFGLSSDLWSLGITLMELAIGCYPFPAFDPVDFVRSFDPDLEFNMKEHWRAARTGEPLPALQAARSEQMGLFDLFADIVERPPPRLPAYCFSSGFIHLVHSCLQKEPVDRLSIEVLQSHILPPLLTNSDKATSGTPTHPSDVSVLGYLNGMFSREQDEAVNAVVLAVGPDLMDGPDGDVPSAMADSWNLSSANHMMVTSLDSS